MTLPLPSGATHAASVSPEAARGGGFGLRELPLLAGLSLASGIGAGALAIIHESLTCAAVSGVLCGAGALAFALRPFLRRMALRARRAEAEALEARAALARAEAESAAKSRFLAEMSHELRTPLNAVIGFSEMMAHEVLGPHGVATYGDYARDIHASGRLLLSLADDILDLARIETGHRALLETAVSLADLASDCGQMMRLAAADRAITLTIRPMTAPVRLWADERALRQMVLNLVANAVKFTPQGGEVRLAAGLDGDGAPFLAVEDTGPGLGEAELPLDLAARHRESTLDTGTGRGAGLGLTIVHGLAGLHGAQLHLATRTGGGTRATITFPPARRLPAADTGARAGLTSAGV